MQKLEEVKVKILNTFPLCRLKLLRNPSKLQMDTKLWRAVVQPAHTRGTSGQILCTSIALLVLTCWTGLIDASLLTWIYRALQPSEWGFDFSE